MTVILVLLTLVAFLVADYLVQRARKVRAVQAAFAVISVPPPRVQLLANHTWIRREADGTFVLGIDDFLSRVAGAVERIALPEPGSVVGPARTQFALTSAGRLLQFASPLQGKTVAVNTELLRSPSLALEDPYSRGWLARIAPVADPGTPVPHTVERPGAWLREQWAEFKEFISARGGSGAPVLLQDGGLPVGGILQGYDADVWREFTAAFITLGVGGIKSGEGPR